MYEAHGDEETTAERQKRKKGALKDDEDHIKDLEKDEEDDNEDEDEETLSESKSLKHGARPKLIGVPILR